VGSDIFLGWRKETKKLVTSGILEQNENKEHVFSILFSL
jgi:hypothetical protein